jgi:preprotein translocase subunit SecA
LARYQAFASKVASLIELRCTDGAEVGGFGIGKAPLRQRYPVDDDCEGDEALSSVFAHVCAVLYSTLNLRAYPTQIMAARVMLDGRVAEMATGEGKTVAIAIAAAVAALENPAVHVITANDYLAERDAREMAPFYAALGLSVGAVTQPMDKQSRATAWGHRITYCSAKELVFDYLRDGLIRRAGEADLERRARRLVGGSTSEALLLPALCVAIVDEIDTVLIDEASVPLVLSQQGASEPEQPFLYEALAQAARMQIGEDFALHPPSKDVVLTAAGRHRLSSWPKTHDSLHNQIRHREATVTLALVALHALHRDLDYVLLKGEVVIIDPSTGRAAIGRAWSRGLHQLVEIKEGCRTSRRTDTVSRITYQRFFPRYRLLSGMSGTVAGSEYELGAVYNLRMVTVPPRLPSLCRHFPLALHANTAALWDAVVQNAVSIHATGRPVLIGTGSVSDSDRLAALFAKAGLTTAVLNARQDQAESDIISAAGQPGRITVATSMAGRGTDIKLGADALRVGGLHVILCQHNISRRIDRQFLGRTARQGQPGSWQIMLALDFPLLRGVFPDRFRPQLLLLPKLVLQATVRCCQGFAAYTASLQRQSLSRADDDSERELLFNREKFS